MRRAFLILFCLLAACQAFAQTTINRPPSLIPFQGRLAKPDGTPVADAAYTLTLSLWDSASNGNKRWEQTFGGVNVRNGAFAVILDLTTGFTIGSTLDSTLNNNTYLQIRVGTNNPQTPRLQLLSAPYALKAATVPDGSITPAKLSADARSLSGPAGGDLHGSYPTPQINTDPSLLSKVSGTLLSVPASVSTVATDQEQPAATAIIINSAWQSFTPGATATLVELGIYCGTTGSSVPATLSLYAGEGTATTPLLTVPITINAAMGMQSFPISLNVTAGQVYTWSIGSNNNLRFGYTGGNPYADGLANLGANFDYAFRTVRKVNPAPATQINALANLYLTGLNSVLGDAQTAPMITRQYNPFTGGAYNGIGRFGLFMEPNTLFLGIPGTDVADSSLRLGTWNLDGTARADLLTLLNSGNLGIGTATPAQRLEVAGSASISGSLGIGLSSPAAALDVNGTVRFRGGNPAQGYVLVSQNASGDVTWSSPAAALGPAGGDLTGAYPAPSIALGAVTTGKLADNAVTTAKIADGAVGSTDLALEAASLGRVSGNALFSAGGRIGAGTATPGMSLEVTTPSYYSAPALGASVGTTRWLYQHASSADHAVIWNSGSALRFGTEATRGGGFTELARIAGNGNVGIGTNAPGSRLTVNGAAEVAGLLVDRAGVNNGTLGFAAGGLVFGSTASGEGIASRRGAGINQFGLDLYTASARRMSITNTGRVGIGTGSPQAPLHVTGARTVANGDGNWFFYTFGDGDGTYDIGSMGSVVGFFDGDLVAQGGIASMNVSSWSDARAKTVIGRSNGAQDLRLLDRIQITDYRWIDQREDPHRIHKKVLAQEVEQVLPDAISRTRKVVPSVYAKATKLQYDAARRLLILTVEKAHDFKPGDKVDVYTDRGDLIQTPVLATPSRMVFTIACENAPSGAFVYGKWVDDYRMVDYDAISMLNVSATQELHRQLQAKNTEIGELKAANAEMKARLEALEAAVQRLASEGRR